MGQLSMEVYLKQLIIRYRKASKAEKTIMLREFCETSGYHRKHAIRLLNQKIYVKKQVKKRDSIVFWRSLFANSGLIFSKSNIQVNEATECT